MYPPVLRVLPRYGTSQVLQVTLGMLCPCMCRCHPCVLASAPLHVMACGANDTTQMVGGACKTLD